MLRLVCPDLEIDKDDPLSGNAPGRIAIRELGKTDTPEAWDADVKVERVSAIDIIAGEPPRVLLSFAVTSDTSVPDRALALFELGPTPRLVDAVMVPGFPDDTGDYSSRLSLSSNSAAYVFSAYHYNSSQGYESAKILFVNGIRIEPVEELGLLSCNRIGEAQGFQESIDISSAPDPGRLYGKIVIRVTFKWVADPPDSEHRPLRRASTRYYTCLLYTSDAADE